MARRAALPPLGGRHLLIRYAPERLGEDHQCRPLALLFCKTHKLNTADPAVRDSLLHFSQPVRKVRLLGVPLTRVRSDFQLKSTFFSVDYDAATKNVILRGHGYGHGVGLSQEGAIRMVGLGIAYDSILHHYYTGAVLYHDPYSQS